MTTTTRSKAEEQKAAPPISVWEMECGGASVLRDRKSMGTNLEGGIEGFLARGQYAPMPGNIGVYEAYETTSADIPCRFQIVARYPNVTLLIHCTSTREFEAFMERYGAIGQVLHYRLLPERKPQAPNNTITEYRPRPRW